ncbi:hypothetical protein G7Z17_g5525 [Cylindrodendrum hubeiense]|uniref:Uncharacterized protein n=1 Tax=Cylindrodendrum hubeiense TaxID=595255 RepID=A0A9P5HES6_9HYPO|nr:hypothetical protein G7Z17_g5525 [Cylindrodendrum hubeiense]
MDTSNDLRSVNESDPHGWMTRDQLCTEPPHAFKTADIGAETSGLDCLVQVIRHTNSFLLEHYRLDDEGENPILPYAWQDFNIRRKANPRLLDPDHTDGSLAWELSQALDTKKRLLEDLKSKVPGGLSFQILASSSLMNETLWSSTTWDLVQAKINMETAQLVVESTRLQRGESGLLRYHCDQHSNVDIQTFIYDVFQRSRSEVLISRRPEFMRVEYLSNPHEPHHIDALRNFQVPLCSFEEDDVPYEEQWYSLVAVVRMREFDTGRDFVRTYSEGGYPVQMVQSPITFISDKWRINDKGGHSYMLFFVRAAMPVPLSPPETLGPAAIKKSHDPDGAIKCLFDLMDLEDETPDSISAALSSPGSSQAGEGISQESTRPSPAQRGVDLSQPLPTRTGGSTHGLGSSQELDGSPPEAVHSAKRPEQDAEMPRRGSSESPRPPRPSKRELSRKRGDSPPNKVRSEKRLGQGSRMPQQG